MGELVKNDNEENIIWLVTVMKQYVDDDYTAMSGYKWERYIGKDDFKNICRMVDPENTEEIYDIETDRKGQVVTSTTNAYLEDNTCVESSAPIVSEMYKDTNILLKEKTISCDGNDCEKEIILQKEEVKDNITHLDILYKNENVLMKYFIYPDNVIKSEKYANNIKIEESIQQEYYFQNTLVTYLTNMVYHINAETSMETEMYVESKALIDENTAFITIVQENKEYGDETVTEYIMKKHIREKDGKVTPIE